MIHASNTTQLVILAAGLGSRFGGLKQMTAMGAAGEWLLEFALYDAYKAGIRRLVLIVQAPMVPLLEDHLLTALKPYFEVRLALQDRDHLPQSLNSLDTSKRTKPWGTAHALWCAVDVIDADFIVMNADDYYGLSCFETLLNAPKVPDGLLGFTLKNTLSDHGGVSRGIITRTQKDDLLAIEEQHDLRATHLSHDLLNQLVSMNMWYLTREWPQRMAGFLHDKLSTYQDDPETLATIECYLPEAIGTLSRQLKIPIAVIPAHDKWHGVTYPQDSHLTKEALATLQSKGYYPTPIWSRKEDAKT